jgi:hypothetical protein
MGSIAVVGKVSVRKIVVNDEAAEADGVCVFILLLLRPGLRPARRNPWCEVGGRGWWCRSDAMAVGGGTRAGDGWEKRRDEVNFSTLAAFKIRRC